MLPEAAIELAKYQAFLKRSTIYRTQRAFNHVAPEAISQTLRLQIPGLVESFGEIQKAAATAGALYTVKALEDQGLDFDGSDFVNPHAWVGMNSFGDRLDQTIYHAAPQAKQLIKSGKTPAQALEIVTQQTASIMSSIVTDTIRQSTSSVIASTGRAGYVRMLNPPSCKYCAILAGRFYRWNKGFKRHNRCDCVHVPTGVKSTEEASQDGIVDDPYEYFKSLPEDERNRIFGKAASQAINDGADIYKVVNADRGKSKLDGLTTTEGMKRTPKARWGLAHGKEFPRLTPEAIYQLAGSDREKARTLLRQHGYLLHAGQVKGGSIKGAAYEGFGQFGRGGKRKKASDAILTARASGVRDPDSIYTMTAAERRKYEAQRRWDLIEKHGISPTSPGAPELWGSAKIRGTLREATKQDRINAWRDLQWQIASDGAAIVEGGVLSRLPENWREPPKHGTPNIRRAHAGLITFDLPKNN